MIIARSVQRPLAVMAAAVLLSACASTRAPADPADPFTRSAETVGLVRAQPPQTLVRAGEHPYAPAADCEAIRGQLAELDAVLGPDVDAQARDDGGDLAAGLIGGLIPYGGIIRQVSGAAQRDRQIERAVLAGVARRGFLKGQARGLGCALGAAVSAAG